MISKIAKTVAFAVAAFGGENEFLSKFFNFNRKILKHPYFINLYFSNLISSY